MSSFCNFPIQVKIRQKVSLGGNNKNKLMKKDELEQIRNKRFKGNMVHSRAVPQNDWVKQPKYFLGL